MKWIVPFVICVTILFVLYSYAFIDAGLVLSKNPPVSSIVNVLVNNYRSNRLYYALMYILFVSLYFGFYLFLFKRYEYVRNYKAVIVSIPLILTLAYPAFTHDVFNYITTAKVVFHYHENSYIVMPIEILNEPNLSFTRASNKVALYGPIWILFTYIPYILGMQNIWVTIISFKFINYLLYLLMIFLIWKKTKQWENVCFFACNPLVLFETLVNGHNDLFMMLLAVSGLLLFQSQRMIRKIFGFSFLFLSIFTKGATLIIFPFLFAVQKRYFWKVMAICMFFVFLLTPIREELYPWYAVWFLVPLSFVSWKEWGLIRELSIALSFGLLLRHAPYIATYNYGGEGPMFRIILTGLPITILFLFYCAKYIVYKSQTTNHNDQTNTK